MSSCPDAATDLSNITWITKAIVVPTVNQSKIKTYAAVGRQPIGDDSTNGEILDSAVVGRTSKEVLERIGVIRGMRRF
jgi:hypothetical protein